MSILEKLHVEVEADRAKAAAAEKIECERRQQKFSRLVDCIIEGEEPSVSEIREILDQCGFNATALSNAVRERQEERIKRGHLERLDELRVEALATMADAAARRGVLEAELREATDFAGAVLAMCGHVKQFGYSSTLIAFLCEAEKQK